MQGLSENRKPTIILQPQKKTTTKGETTIVEETTLRPATQEEIRQYYHEEYNIKEIPKYITKNLHRREFAFDRIGRGPRDRYNQFAQTRYLERTIKAKAPYAAYSSIALYDNPTKREGWTSAEMVFDVDAKDNPLRTCNCTTGKVCPHCLEEAKQIILKISDNTKELGYKDIHYVYTIKWKIFKCCFMNKLRIKKEKKLKYFFVSSS